LSPGECDCESEAENDEKFDFFPEFVLKSLASYEKSLNCLSHVVIYLSLSILDEIKISKTPTRVMAIAVYVSER